MGVPVITLPRESGISRGGLSILSQLGLNEWVARDAGDYVRIASHLAADQSQLEEHRRTLRNRMQQSSLMDAAGFARDFESALRRMCAEKITSPSR